MRRNHAFLHASSMAVVDLPRLIERDDIDVGGVVEFSSSVLAHPYNCVAAVFQRVCGICQHEVAAFMGG